MMHIYTIIKRLAYRMRFFLRMPEFIFRKNSFGQSIFIEKDVYIRNCTIGNYVYLGIRSFFSNVDIGNYSSIAADVIIGAMEHPYWDLSTSTLLSNEGYDNKRTIIGHDVWVGTKCVIRQGVSIGDGAVIGANTFVNKDIPPYAIAFGTPVRVYKMRFSEDIIKELKNSRYWDFEPNCAKKILEKIKNNNNV